jgi:two-component system response regulator AtoC
MSARSDVEQARARAKSLRKRGDLAGALRELESALAGADGLDRAKVEADLGELRREVEAQATGVIQLPAAAPEGAGEPLPDASPDADGIVGKSAGIAKLRAQLAKSAKADAPVLVVGESGSGKELVARAVHRRSSRASEPFLALAAAALAPGLVEAELFGHAAGAFTGATGARPGLLVEAGKGTLLLDGIDETPVDVQAKLLRVLEAGGEVRPGGGGTSRRSECRIVATTRRALGPLVRAGAFREDLYFRRVVLTLHVPPLRERPEDVPLLVRALVDRHRGSRPRPLATKGALAKLASYPWPGNVRELENEVRRILVAGAATIDEASLAPAIRSGVAPGQEELTTGLFQRLRGKTMDQVEKAAIMAALKACDGNRSRAAQMLQVSRRALYDKIKRLKIGEVKKGKK